MTRRLLVTLLVVGCGEGDDTPLVADAGTTFEPLPETAGRAICDGRDGLTFAFQAGGGFPPAPPARLYVELGSYLYVDGHCRYWVSGDYQRDGRTGVLSAAQEAELTELSHFRAWPAVADSYLCEGAPPPDSGHAGYRDGEHGLRCPGGCRDDELPAEIVEACGSGRAGLFAELHAAGEPLATPARYYLVEGNGKPYPAVAWPLAEPPATYLTPLDGRLGYPPGRIDDVDDARALRELKDAYLDAHRFSAGAVWIDNPGGAPLELYVRDTLPFEDDAGVVDF